MADQRQAPQFTEEEIQKMREVQRKMFRGVQLPLTGISTYLAYYLTKSGIWKSRSTELTKPSFRLYFPRCFGTMVFVYTTSQIFVMSQVHKELLALNGAYSQMVKDGANRANINAGRHPTSYARTPPSQSSAPPTATDDYVTDDTVIENIMKGGKTEETQPLPSRGLTYEDLRRRHRLSQNPPPAQGNTTQNQPTSPTDTPPSLPALVTPSNKGKKNKYGDDWSEV